MLFKCKMCGGDLDVKKGDTFSRCPYCGTNQTISPAVSVSTSAIIPDNEPALLADMAHAMVLRGNLALEDGEFELADYYFERSLDSNPCSGRAYLGKFLASKKAPSLATLKDEIINLDTDRNFQRAIEFSDQELASELSQAIASNKSNINKARKAEAEYKAALEERRTKFDNAKHKAFRLLFKDDTGSGAINARQLFSGVEDICSEQYTHLNIDNLIEIVQSISGALAGRAIFSEAELLEHLDATGKNRRDIRTVLSELVNDNLVEAAQDQSGIKYGLPGAKAEDDERRKRKLLSKLLLVLKERYYRDTCSSIEADVQAELRPLSKAIASKYASDIEAARCDLGNAESAAMREKVRLQMEISKLKAKRNSLGLFNEQRKAAIDEKIASADIQLGVLSSPEQIRATILPRIEGLIARRDEEFQAAEANVRARHPFPDKKSFFEEMSKRCNPE